MNYLFNILIILYFVIPLQKDPRFNKKGLPSTYGIEQTIKNHQDSYVKEYEYKIQDSLYDVVVFTEDLGDKGELGEFYIPDQVVITNREKFIAYEFKDLTKFKQKTSTYNERTLKAVLFHELTHAYVNQILVYMRRDSMHVSSEYGAFRLFPNPTSRFGAEFIEEGICEYIVYFLNECAPMPKLPIPTTQEELMLNNGNVILYQYSVLYLQDFLKEKGLKRGIQILLENKPPTYEEMLKPELFFNRLK